MIDELRARFLPRFVETTRGRLARARALFETGDPRGLAHELHALAGEARMLDLFAIAEDALRGEVAARAWSDGAGEAPRADCGSCIETVDAAIASLRASPGGPA